MFGQRSFPPGVSSTQFPEASRCIPDGMEVWVPVMFGQRSEVSGVVVGVEVETGGISTVEVALARHESEAPPFEPAQDQDQPLAVVETAESVPAVQRLATGAEETVVPSAEPQAPSTLTKVVLAKHEASV
jgi:hypothetical protein